MKRLFYIAVFHNEDNRYWVSFPDFPECFTQGDTIEDTFRYAQEALELCIEERIKNKEELPKPTIEFNSGNDRQVLLSYECAANVLFA